MQTGDNKLYTATLVAAKRITPETSKEDVRHLVFKTTDAAFAGQIGQCIRVQVPGQFGNRYHSRFYSLAELERHGQDGTEFSLCVRRCSYVDEFNGEEYAGVASNFLCDLKPGAGIEFNAPSGYPFTVPANHNSDIVMIGMGTGIAPFRGLIRLIYEKFGNWQGKVRLFYGARTGLELLYMNDVNKDLANYYDQATFKAFQAVSPRPHFDVPVALDRVIEQNAAEVWAMMQNPNSYVYVAGLQVMLDMIETALTGIAGSAAAWQRTRNALVDSGRWNEVIY